MLTSYITVTRDLLQLPNETSSQLYPDTALTRWINIARGQLAGEAECIRVLGTLTTVIDQRRYLFSGLNLGVQATTGVAGVIHIRDILFGIASGYKKTTPRGWEWFQQYALNNAVPVSGLPHSWAQYGQGAAAPTGGSGSSGSFYLNPPPDNTYALTCDCVCYPAPLTDNTTVEAIPYLWTDAVPFFAAYYALLSSQTSARQADAERMYGHYQTFVERARTASNPSVLRSQYAQATDPTQINKLGLQKAAGAGAG